MLVRKIRMPVRAERAVFFAALAAYRPHIALPVPYLPAGESGEQFAVLHHKFRGQHNLLFRREAQLPVRQLHADAVCADIVEQFRECRRPRLLLNCCTKVTDSDKRVTLDIFSDSNGLWLF